MTNQSGQARLLGFLLLLVCLVRLDALKSPRGVRGSSASRILTSSSEKVVGLNLDRDLQETFKKDEDKDNKEDEEMPVIENAEGEEEDKEEDKEETEEPTDVPKDDKEEYEETEEPTDPPKEQDDDEEAEEPQDEDEETDAPAPDDETETEDESVAETESTLAPEDIVEIVEPAVEETSATVAELPTDAPVIVETVAPNENATDMYTITLAPFTIELDYEETITEDPGIEEYLTFEMMRGGGHNLEEIELDMTVATVYGRRRLKSQVLYYTGIAVFEGLPVWEEAEMQGLQNQILTNEEAVSTVIAISLGENPANFTVSAVAVEVDAIAAEEPTGAQEEAEEEGLSTTGLAIVLVAACVGALSLTIICLVAVRKPEQKLQPYGGASQSLKVSTKSPDDAKKPEDKAEELNKTFDTEEDQVHEEFADKMEKHTFDGSWNDGKGSVRALASVGKGSFNENDNEADGVKPDDIKEELGQQLSELQASVKAAREKTQKLLDESKA